MERTEELSAFDFKYNRTKAQHDVFNPFDQIWTNPKKSSELFLNDESLF